MDFGFGPHERFGGGVVACDVGIDVGFQFLDRGKGCARQRLALEAGKPALDLIKPRRPCRGVVESDEGMLFEPFLVLFMRIQIVEDNLKLAARIGRDQPRP